MADRPVTSNFPKIHHLDHLDIQSLFYYSTKSHLIEILVWLYANSGMEHQVLEAWTVLMPVIPEIFLIIQVAPSIMISGTCLQVFFLIILDSSNILLPNFKMIF